MPAPALTIRRPLEIGPTCQPIPEQLKGCLLADDAAFLEADHQALNRLYLRGYIRDREFDRAARQLMEKAQLAVSKFTDRAARGLLAQLRKG